jgi:hypothetical protein
MRHNGKVRPMTDPKKSQSRRRRAAVKTVFRKNKIVLEFRGRKIFETKNMADIKVFLSGFYGTSV